MTRARRIASALLVATTLSASAACRSATSATPPLPPAAPPATAAPSAPLSNAIRWTRDSAEHKAVFLQTYRAATAHVEQEAARRPGGGWAVVLDADETVIDNSVYQVERERAGLPFDGPSWNAWTKRREAVPLPGAKPSSRASARSAAASRSSPTAPSASAPTPRPSFAPTPWPSTSSSASPTSARATKTRASSPSRRAPPTRPAPARHRGLRRRQHHDFPAQSQAIRNQPDNAFAPFRTRFFALPNPMYGSWEGN